MRGQRLSEKSYELIKQMLVQGYSVKKVQQMLPDEISVSPQVIYRVNSSENYKDYLGVKEDEPKKVVQVTPYTHTKEVVDAINRTNILLESLFQRVNDLVKLLE